MKIATILFTFNRPEQTKQVLLALEQNELLPEKLFIFQDGKKESTDEQRWNQVSEVINSVRWCDTEVHIMEMNKGCARSVIDGVNYVLDRYDAVIVLEDDCVPHPQFMTYMNNALTKYENEKKVYSISGDRYNYYLEKREGEADAFFNGRICSTGWGTWKDRWSQFEEDYLIIRRIKKDPEKREALEIWGADLEDMLIGNIDGRCDSWAVFWALKVIEKGGMCLNPYESLIRNIGFDGSGTHSGNIRIDIKKRDFSNRAEIVLPDILECTSECKKEFKMYYSRTPRVKSLAMVRTLLCESFIRYMQGAEIKKIEESKRISIWGTGALCDLLLDTILSENKIDSIIETFPKTKLYRGISVISCSEIPKEVELIIVVPYWDMEGIKHKLEMERVRAQIMGLDEIL